MFFNHCDAGEIDKTQLEQILVREIKKYVQGEKFSENSVKNDVNVLLNMYSKTQKSFDPEDKNVSPFVNLKIVNNVDKP